MSEYVIARASVVDIDTGEDFEEVFYKVFLKDSDGVVWFEHDFDSLDEAREYVRVAEENPELTTAQRMELMQW